MKILLRVVGVVLLLLGALNLFALYTVDLKAFQDPALSILRNFFMALSGLGYTFLRKWGVPIYFVSLTINWIAYFTVYDGQGSLVSLWATIPVPVLIGLVSYFGWRQLEWSSGRSLNDND